MKTIIFIATCFFLLLCFDVESADRIYTDEDLQKYYFKPLLKKPISNKGHVSGVARSGTRPGELNVKSPPVIKLRLQGCPTLQDSLDKKYRGSGSLEFKLYTKGRTLQEICDTVGNGCNVCKEVK